jgi:hypothetical protein
MGTAASAHAQNRDLGAFLGTHAGQASMHGAWGWYGVLLVCFLFNTVLGEELLFRGFLLPRMNGAFGRRDWVANGLLFPAYHLHVPWVIPGNAAEHVHPRLSVQAIPPRLDRHRHPPLPERVLRSHRAQPRPLTPSPRFTPLESCESSLAGLQRWRQSPRFEKAHRVL